VPPGGFACRYSSRRWWLPCSQTIRPLEILCKDSLAHKILPDTCQTIAAWDAVQYGNCAR